MLSIKKISLFFIVLVVLSTNIFAQNYDNKYYPQDNIIGVSVGFGGMADVGIFKNRAGSAIATAHIGITYNHYFDNYLAVNTGFMFHSELYTKLKQDLPSGAKLINYMKAPFCLTIPVGFSFNIPRMEWLYMGAGVNMNIPIANMNSTQSRTKEILFVGIPVDLGVDFMKYNISGFRLFLRVTPTFHKEGVFAPIGLVWQYNWKVTPPKPKVKRVVVPPPPVIIIVR